MKSFFIICATTLIFIFTCFVNLSAQEIILLGDDAYPPYSYYEKGEARGIYVDIIKEAFKSIENYEVKFEMMPWKRCITNIKKGRNIAFFPPYHSEEREAWINFSEPILQEQVVVFGKEKNLVGKTKWPEDFYGYTIGLNAGFSPASMAGQSFDLAVKNNKVTVDEGKNNEINLKKLEAGRIDFYINDKFIDTSAYPSIKRGIVAKNNLGYLGFTKHQNNFTYYGDFKTKFDKAIKQMKSSGKIDEIINTYAK